MSTSPEVCIIKLFVKDRDAYETFYNEIKDFNYEPEVKIIINIIHKYYVNYDTHTYIGKEELLTYYHANYPIHSSKDTITTIIDLAYQMEVSDSVAKDIIRNAIEKDAALAIIDKLTPVITDSKFGILQSLSEDISKYTKLIEAQDQESLFITTDLEELYKQKIASRRPIKWRLQCLQDSLGTIDDAILGHVFARPETGKTSFLASEATHIAKQLIEDETILWFNNEQAGIKVIERLYSAMLNRTKDLIINNIEAAKDRYISMGGDRIKLYDNAFISIDRIRSILKSTNPRLVIIDQGDKVTFSGASKLAGHDRLKELYRMFRELAKEFDTHMLTVGQASAEGEGKKWLTYNHMDCSHTGKPGEMDYIIGIGKLMNGGDLDDDDEIRYLHFCKNKLLGKHTKHIVKLETQTGRYIDI